MSLSFADSLKKTQQQNTTSAVSALSMEDAVSVASLSLEDDSAVESEASVDAAMLTATNDSWTKPNNAEIYTYYNNEYYDAKISTVDESKQITLSEGQINLTQEKNSQYIPFEINRYYDGFDLSKTTLSIYWVNDKQSGSFAVPVDVYYNSDKIRFAWLVDNNVTRYAGGIKFEIQASGTNSQGLSYLWKTKPSSGLNVLQALEVTTFIEPDEAWQTGFIGQLETQANNAVSAAKTAEAAAATATEALTTVQSIKSELIDGIESEVAEALGETLSDYATTEYVDGEIATVNTAIETQGSAMKTYTDESISSFNATTVTPLSNNLSNNYYTKTQTDEKVTTALEDYATKSDVQEAIDSADLDSYYKKTETYSQTEVDEKLEGLATETYVDDAIASADLDSYYKKDETYSQAEIDAKLDNVSIDLTGYATETYVNNKVEPLSTAIASNANNITSLGTTVANLQDVVDELDTSSNTVYTYDVAYNDTEDENVGENVFVLYEIENEGTEEESREVKKKFTIVGGSGGGGTSSTLKIGYVTTSPLVITTNDKAIISYTFSGTDSSGDEVPEGTATWKVGGKLVATSTALSGENSFDITDHISIGTQKVLLTITDDAGSLATKSWTVQKVDVKIESDFNDTITYPLGEVAFSYKPYGSIDKTVHFKMDGVELTSVSTKASGIPMSYTLSSQKHGAHLVETYITAELNGNAIESNHVLKDVIWYDSTSNVPVIGCTQQSFTAKQYDSTNITYTVYDPSTETPTVVLAVDGETVSTLTLDTPTNVWQFKSSDVGTHVLTITCGTAVKTINVTIEKLDIDVSPVTAGLEFDFNPSGYSNNDADRLWSDGDVSMIVSDNFDWVNGGYQIDDNGDQYFCVKSGTSAVINYNLFADDPKRNGKEFKLVFKTTNVRDRDTSFVTCMNNNIGIDMKVESANIYSSNNSLYSPYCEDDIIEFEFNINKDIDIPMVLTYEDGVGNRPMIYTSDASFMQTTPQPITIGSNDCDVHIYRIKAYSNSLSDSDILSNFIADARSADEMVSRYNRNQIYDENGLLTPEVLAEKCPDLRIIMVDAPWFTNDKSNKVDDTNITMIYKNGDAVLDNWTCTGARHSGQGTSSNEYGYSGRNMDLIMDGDSALFTLGDGVTTSKTITLTRNSTPTDYLNVKLNIASSENQNNAQMTMRFNEYQPYKRTARLKDSKVRDTMEFYNCVVFIRERNEDISTHREFTDCEYHYYGLGNVGDSKKTDDSRVNDKSDPKECCIEIMDYNVALAEFPTGYTDAGGNKAICPESEWKAGNTAYDYLYADYIYKDGEFKSFGSESYEFRYEMKGITEEQRQANIDAWREAYKFVVTSADEEFYSNFSKYFVQDSILYFYLFTERYTMVDNRAKNCFLHRGKAYYSTEEAAEFALTYGVQIDDEYIDDEQASFNDGYRWDLTWGYDFDTCLGISNTGKLEITYGKEDIDYYVDGDPTSSYIYRAAESTFFCRVRDLFNSELQAMFVDRENVNAWSSDGLINQWDTSQSQFPEEVWRLDIQRKYLRTYQGVSIDSSIAGTANQRFLVEMLNGRKKYQRRMFERNQELYFATKYFGNKATQDQIMMRFNNPVGAAVKQDFTLYLTPYSDMYIGVKFGNVTPTNFRAKAGVEYTIPYGIDADTADITLIYGASFIQAIGDLSKCYVGDNDFSKASRLQSLVIGSDATGYTNTYMTKITLGNNKLLEYLDIKNVTGLNSVVDLSQCSNLLELHAEGSGATGVIFANGGKLKKAYIPSVVSLTAKNLNEIEEFSIASYDNLQTLIVENTPFLNTYEIVSSADKLSILRLIGMDWNADYQIEDASILNRLLTIRGIGNDGYETAISVLTGYFYASLVRQRELTIFSETWKDLEIGYNTLVEQYAVTFKNDDGTILEVQYVDKGADAVDPVTREDNPIAVPTKASSVSTNYTYAGWDSSLENIFSDRTITAIYSESLRQYTIKYVSKGTTLQESTGLYGDNVLYTGTTPTYTAEEGGYKFYLFDHWDKSGFIDGNKTVNAVFNMFEYTDGYFSDKQLGNLTPIELYALTKIGIDTVSMDIQDGDDYSFRLGYDVDYEDIESETIVSSKTTFDGTNYIDSGIALFDGTKDFVLAMDYEMSSNSTDGGVLAQCFQSNGSNGFKLWYNSGVKFTWGTSSQTPSSVASREMIVIRYKASENNITIYNSNLNSTSMTTYTLTRTKATVTDSTFVLGCTKADDGSYENFGLGDVYWCKVWFKDLGAEACQDLANWIHEDVTLEVCGLKRYYLSENSSQRCSFSLLGTHLLTHYAAYNSSSTNAGGWASSSLKTFLNSRLYNAVPIQMRQLLKKVVVSSTAGSSSTEITSSDCYVTVPAVFEVSSSYKNEPYVYEAPSTISYMTSNSARMRATRSGVYYQYWTRSPYIYSSSSYYSTRYIYSVTNTGYIDYNYASYKYGVLMEISI